MAGPEEDKIRDKIFPDQMHEVIQKELGKPQGPKSTEKRDPFDARRLCKLLSLYFCVCGLHCLGLGHSDRASTAVSSLNDTQQYWLVRDDCGRTAAHKASCFASLGYE